MFYFVKFITKFTIYLTMYTQNKSKKTLFLAMSFYFFSGNSFAESFNPAVDGFIRNQQRQEDLEKIIKPSRDVSSDVQQKKISHTFEDIKEEHCFPIQSVKLSGEMTSKFEPYLQQILKQLAYRPGLCMGEQSIDLLMRSTQNLIIAKGYTTTRILAAPQNLSSGVLELTVLPGLIREIKLDLENTELSHADRIQYANNIFPIKAGDVLNLRALEQGLENLKRVPTADAAFEIVPADRPNESDVLVKWKQRRIPARVTLSVDDAGSQQTGRYQGNITLSLDNPLYRSDLFYLTLGRNLADQMTLSDNKGKTVKSGTNNYAVHYSIPLKNWLLSFNASEYRYDQAVAGFENVLNYNGRSRNQDLSLTRLLYRDAKRKTSATIKGWHRASQNAIDDAELTDQNKSVSGWQLALDHREYIKTATVDLGLSYKRGTGAFGAKRFVEEQFGEASSRMEIWNLDINYNQPFLWFEQNFNYASALKIQYNETPLSPQDRLSIGGRYSVRGFDGNLTLSADRGVVWRNDLSYFYVPAHQVYLAFDAGRVDGMFADELLGKSLMGSALGLRGQFKMGGNLYYDLFLAKPLKKPEYFKADATTYGFALNYSF